MYLERDQHFSIINQFLRPAILKEKLTCAEEIANTINAHQELANNYRNEINSHKKENKLKLPISITKAFVFTPEISTEHFYRKIENLKFYYNFNSIDGKFSSSVLSGKKISVEVKFKDIFKSIEIENLSGIVEKKIQNSKVSLKNLKKKLSHIRCLMRSPDRFISHSQESSNYYFEKSLPEKPIFGENQPIWCKIHCSKCQAQCSYRLSEINPKNNFLTKEQVKQELKKHKHPQSRINKITKKNRSLEESKRELFLHYVNYHKQI